MKRIETSLSERGFTERMEMFCEPYVKYSEMKYKRGFLIKRNGKRFSILLRMETSRGFGYSAEWLFGKYTVNERGCVEVSYVFRKPFLHLLPFLVMVLSGVCLIVGVGVTCRTDPFGSYALDLLASLFLAGCGLGGMLMHSKSVRRMLQRRLEKICSLKAVEISAVL